MDLYEKYGYVILPKSLKLYHWCKNELDLSKSADYNYTLFCTFGDEWGGKHIYEIELLQDYKVLLAIKDFTANRLKCSLLEIANDHGSLYDHELTDFHDNTVFIKKLQKNRDPIINYLREKGIEGWLASLEGGGYIEVCLFTKDIDNFYSVKKINKEDVCCSLNIYFPELKFGNCNQLNNHVKKYFKSFAQEELESPENFYNDKLGWFNMTKILKSNEYLD